MAPRRGADRVAVATAGAVLVLTGALFATVRSSPIPARVPAASPATENAVMLATPAPTEVPLGWWTYLSLPQQLALPPGATGVDLWAMPDRLVNEPPDVRLRLAIQVRGTSGLATMDHPAEIAWTEGGFWYQLRSRSLTIPQLIDLAGALQ